MLLNSLSFYLSFSVYFDCGLVFIIQFFQWKGLKMDEDSQVLRKRYLFNLADKITRYANHWLFMKICLRCNITPNGLKLKKTPQIGKISEDFLSQWKAIMFKAETNLVESLVSEYRTQTLVLQVEFWKKLTEYLEGAAEIGEARNLHAELCDRNEQAEKRISIRRRSKLSKIWVVKHWL